MRFRVLTLGFKGIGFRLEGMEEVPSLMESSLCRTDSIKWRSSTTKRPE